VPPIPDRQGDPVQEITCSGVPSGDSPC
jgi:hypothetical protein